MFKSYKYRLYPNDYQAKEIDKTISVCRLIYNLSLETRIRAFQLGVKLTAFDLIKQLPELKEANPWMKEVASQTLLSSILRMDEAFKGFFKGKGYPKFKKRRIAGSFEYPNGRRRVDWENSTLIIPIISPIKIIASRKFDGEIRKITISKSATGKYFASILVKVVKDIPVLKSTESIGIDLGLSSFATLSDGTKIENPKYHKLNILRMKVLQRRASRKKKGSKNKAKAQFKVSILHERISNQRKDFLHKASTNIIRDNQAVNIYVEDLAVSNLIKNKNLSKSISDAGWAEFIRCLTYKATWMGKTVVKINRYFPSSKTCSNCGFLISEIPLSIREWKCQNCEIVHDRDINAAINIRNIGVSGRGSSVVPVESSTIVEAMKQEDVISNQQQL